MMKRRLLIVEPSEVIVEGLKAILDGQIRFKVLEPESDIDHLEERILSARPDIVLINPTLLSNVRHLQGEHALALVARRGAERHNRAQEHGHRRTAVVDCRTGHRAVGKVIRFRFPEL